MRTNTFGPDAATGYDLGVDLAAIMRNGLGAESATAVRALVFDMIRTEGTSAADAMPLTYFVATLLPHVAEIRPEPGSPEEDGWRDLMLICAALSMRATRTLEAVPGIAAESFSGDVRVAN